MKNRWSYHLPFSEVLRKFVEFAWKWFGKKIQKKKHDLVYCPTVVMSSACFAFDAGVLHNSLTRKLSSEKILSCCCYIVKVKVKHYSSLWCSKSELWSVTI